MHLFHSCCKVKSCVTAHKPGCCGGGWEGTLNSKEGFRSNFLNTGKNRTLLPMNQVISKETARDRDMYGALDLISHTGRLAPVPEIKQPPCV